MTDTLCKEAVAGNAAAACFYFDFAAQEQSPAAILGSVLKQVVHGLDEVPERIVKAFRDREKTIGGQMLALSELWSSYRISRPHDPHLYALTPWTSVRQDIE